MVYFLSWNVNGLRAVLRKNSLDFFQKGTLGFKPDFIGLQEVKLSQTNTDALEQLKKIFPDYGYAYSFSTIKKGYSGVLSLFSRPPIQVHLLGVSDFDQEGRVIALEYDQFIWVNAYFPNSQDQGARLPYKLAFCQAMYDYAQYWENRGKRFILCGDYNIAHTPIDLARPENNQQSPGFLPEERAWMDWFLNKGYVDSFRHLNPEKRQYSWWSYRAGARAKNVGWRIDYFCVDQKLKTNIEQATIYDSIHGSDHCPVILGLNEQVI